jgi:serine/threonine protein kinase/tetratricopeptide (TPR) repeat protein
VARKSDKELALGETVAHPTPGAPASGSTAGASEHDGPEADPELRDLAPGTPIGDRYVVASVLGRGGMGVVYLARDNSLGRDVALKLHRASSGHERLYREAIAMAQLAHPNVVTVFEVGTVDDQLFVAMEFIRGRTLREWAADKTWRPIVDMMLDAGEGLAAAHRAGLVHRDFKPENVLVGEDGRPRVSDFGLARADAELTASLPPTMTPRPSSSPPRAATPSLTPSTGPLTVTGTVLGTPAYMAPEQYTGGDVDARCDQFSFCVAAWELVFHERPFAGTTLPQLQQAIERHAIAVPADAEVPAAVRRALETGLAARPEDRWADMPALLSALRSAIRPRSKRWAVVGAIAALAIAGGVTFAMTRDRAADCDDGAAELDRFVPPALRAELVAAARSHSGPDAGRRVEQHLAELARDYRAVAVFACRAVDARDWSADIAQRSRDCRQEQALIVAVGIRAILDAPRYANKLVIATTQLDELIDLEVCRNINALATTPARPVDQRDALASARAELATARRQVRAGASAKAQATLARISASPLGKAPEVAPALALVRGDLARDAEQFDAAIRDATDAYYQAHAQADQLTEMAALESLLYWIGTDKQDAKAVESWYRLGLAEVDRYAKLSPLRAANLRAALVGVALTRNDIKVATEQARLAVADLEHGPPMTRVNATRQYASVLAESGDVKHAIPIYEQTERQIIDVLGSDDPQLPMLLADEALTLSEAGRDSDAVAIAHRATTLLDHQPRATIETASVKLNVAAVLLEAGDSDDAEVLLRSARETFEKAVGPDAPAIATIDSDLALIENDRGHFDAGIALLRRALAIQEKALGPDHPDVAATLFNLAAALQKTDDRGGALDAARRSIAIRAKTVPNSDMYLYSVVMAAEIENQLGQHADALRDASAALEIGSPRADFQTVAWPKLQQARALIGLHRDPAGAKRLLDEARTAYDANHMTKRVEEIDALRAKLP